MRECGSSRELLDRIYRRVEGQPRCRRSFQRKAASRYSWTATFASSSADASSQSDCAACPMKARCCPHTPFRKIARSIHEAARDEARRIAATPEYQ